MSFASWLTKRVSIQDAAGTAGAADGMGGHAAPTPNVLYRRVPAQYVAAKRRGENAGIVSRDGKATVYPHGFWYMEYRSGIEEGMLIIWEGRTYGIVLASAWQEAGKYLKLAVVEHGRLE